MCEDTLLRVAGYELENVGSWGMGQGSRKNRYRLQVTGYDFGVSLPLDPLNPWPLGPWFVSPTRCTPLYAVRWLAP